MYNPTVFCCSPSQHWSLWSAEGSKVKRTSISAHTVVYRCFSDLQKKKAIDWQIYSSNSCEHCICMGTCVRLCVYLCISMYHTYTCVLVLGIEHRSLRVLHSVLTKSHPKSLSTLFCFYFVLFWFETERSLSRPGWPYNSLILKFRLAPDLWQSPWLHIPRALITRVIWQTIGCNFFLSLHIYFVVLLFCLGGNRLSLCHHDYREFAVNSRLVFNW